MRQFFALLSAFLAVNMFAEGGIQPRFPGAAEGWTKHEITLPSYEDENDYKLELKFFENKEVDCNKNILFGTLENGVLDGWGYDFYTLKPQMMENANVMISTMMFCNEAPTMQKVYFNVTKIMDYNSKVPLVVYTPSNVELEYITWKKFKTELSK